MEDDIFLKIDPNAEFPAADLALRRRKSPGRATSREWPARMANRETEEQQRLRFQIELEFVQCLANPNYLNFFKNCEDRPKQMKDNHSPVFGWTVVFDSFLLLAQRGYFKEPTFLNYLKYLQYWKEPDYAKYLKYPMCLYFLELVQHEHFRKEIVNAQCAKFIDDQQILHWQHYTRKRMRLLQAQTDHNLVQSQQIQKRES